MITEANIAPVKKNCVTFTRKTVKKALSGHKGRILRAAQKVSGLKRGVFWVKTKEIPILEKPSDDHVTQLEQVGLVKSDAV